MTEITLQNTLIIKTEGFLTLDKKIQDEIVIKALKSLNLQTDFIVFKKEAVKERYEDDNRTLIVPCDVDKKVYVKLDDYKGNEKEAFGNRFVITFMLAEEY